MHICIQGVGEERDTAIGPESIEGGAAQPIRISLFRPPLVLLASRSEYRWQFRQSRHQKLGNLKMSELDAEVSCVRV